MMSPSSDMLAEHMSKSSLAFTHDLSMWLLDNAVKNSRIDVISKTLSLVNSWNKVKNKIASDNQNTKIINRSKLYLSNPAFAEVFGVFLLKRVC